MPISFENKVAIVSGGAQGIGGAHVEGLVRRGAKVVIADLRDEEGEEFAKSLNASGKEKRAQYVHLDVTSAADWTNAVKLAESTFGKLTSLVNNAGFPGREGVEETTEEGWDKTLDVDLKGTWLGMKHCIPAMKRAGGGAIVNTSSTYGLVASGRGIPYHSAKAGVIMLTKAAAVEYAMQTIRVNCVGPGLTDTPRNKTVRPTQLEQLLAGTPMKRMAQPEEIANAACFLLSDEASYITGTMLVVDGGYTSI